MFRYLAACVFWGALFLTFFLRAATATSSPDYALALDQARAQAKTLFDQGNYEESHTLYMRLLREAPDDDEINYGVALTARHTKRDSHALLAFERLVDRYPANPGLRRYLADIYLRLGDRESARRELELARQYDPTLTETSIGRILDNLENAQTRFQVHGRISGGIMYDSNANQGPASDRLQFDALPNALQFSNIKEVGTWGTYVNGMLNMGWRLSDDSPWWVVSDMSFFKRWNSNQELTVNNEFGWGRLSLGLRHLSASTLTELRFKAEQADQQLNQRVSVLGPEFTFLWSPLPNLQFISRGALEQRSYTLDIGRDGLYWWAGEYMRVLLGNSGHEFTVGLRALGTAIIKREYANINNNDDYNYSGLEASLRLRLKITEKFSLLPFASARRDYYYGPPSAIDLADRRDLTYRLGVYATYDLTNNLQLEAGIQYVSNQSNSPLYCYEQQTFTMGLAWSF